MDDIISIGIESTAHTFSIGITDSYNIYSNVRVILKTERGGIHPREAAELHSKEAINIFKAALYKAGFLPIKTKDGKPALVDILSEIYYKLEGKHNVSIRISGVPWKRRRYLLLEDNVEIFIDDNGNIRSTNKELESNIKEITNNILKSFNYKDYNKVINLISYSAGPGLYPTLIQSKFFADLLSKYYSLESIGVNHLVAHIEVVKWYNFFRDPVVLLISGANTMLLSFEKDHYVVVGETLDMGVGNFLDKVARLMGVGFPGGPIIAELASKGKSIIQLPYTVKGMDIQLGGLYTYIKNLLENNKDISLEDLAFSIQEYVFAMVTEVSERALAFMNKKEFGVTGGVAANNRLREMLRIMCYDRNIKFGEVPIDLAADNGAMIALTGLYWKRLGIEGKNEIDPYWRPETVHYPRRLEFHPSNLKYIK